MKARRPQKRGRLPANAPCRCGSGRSYGACCGPLHQGQAPQGVEALMRSRYSAYALGLVEYLIKSTHPEGPHWREDRGLWRRELHQWCKQADFTSLEVLQVEEEPLAQEAFVTFFAQLRDAERDLSFAERSRFVRHEGRWKYLDGHAPSGGSGQGPA